MARFDVEVVFALPETQSLQVVTVETGTTAADCVARSGIARQFPEHDLAEFSLGVWGKQIERSQVVNFVDFFFHKENRDPTLLPGIFTTDFQVVNVVPAVARKRIVNHRSPEEETNLVLRHADFYLIQIFLFDKVALRDCSAVDAATRNNEAEESEEEDNRFAHNHSRLNVLG